MASDKTDFGSQEAARQLAPRTKGDKLLKAIATLITIRNSPGDQDIVKQCLAEDVVVHKDASGAFWSEDKSGLEAFRSAPQQYGSTYNFTRHLVATAVTPNEDWAFAFWFDQGVTVTPQAKDKLPNADQTSDVVGIWAIKGNDDGKVTDLWFYRQLTAQERALRFKDPNMPFQHFDAKRYQEPDELPEDAGRSAKMMDAAAKFDKMYQDGTTSLAAEILADNVRSFDLLFGSQSSDRDQWVAKHDKLFAGGTYNQEFHVSSIAVSKHSNKAFIYWEYKNPSTGDQGGMNVLVFEPSSLKITDIIGFRTPSPGEAKAVLKDDQVNLS